MAQDRADDEKAGIQSLAVLLGDRAWVFLMFLGLAQVAFFAVTALHANMSLIFWVFGVGVWAVNLAWHVMALDLTDSKSGGKIFRANIMLGLYMTVVGLIDLIITRIYLGSLVHFGQHVPAGMME